MPANLTPDYMAAEEKFKAAKTSKEKLKYLQDMMATIPKHKGTEKMQADIKKRIARLKKEEQSQKKTGAKRKDVFLVERAGAGQVALVGFPNTGKSQILASLTTACPEIAPYPFTTRLTIPGMMPFGSIQIQIVDTPPMTEDFMETCMPNIVRHTDLVLLVVDLSSEASLEQIDFIISKFESYKIKLVKDGAVKEDSDVSVAYKTVLILGNKSDLENAGEIEQIIREFYGKRFNIFTVSALKGTNLEELKKEIYRLLNIIRIYSKIPGFEADTGRPFALEKGSTLLDLAKSIHKDFAENLKFARVWGKGKYAGQRVNRDYVLEDEDVIELHM